MVNSVFLPKVLPSHEGQAAPRIGVLALQGAFAAHRNHIEALDCAYIEVRKPEELVGVDGLVIPGGESTTFLKLLDAFNFYPALEDFFRSKKPVWGICAGSILLASKIVNSSQKSLGWIDLEVSRNAYGRQLESFEANILDYTVAFIRAPQFEKIGESATLLAIDPKTGKPAWIEQNQVSASSFHAEINPKAPSPFHAHFVKKVRNDLNLRMLDTPHSELRV